MHSGDAPRDWQTFNVILYECRLVILGYVAYIMEDGSTVGAGIITTRIHTGYWVALN